MNKLITSHHPLLDEIKACRQCHDDLPLGANPVVQLHPAAKLLIIGQAPGTKVHASGIPWDDPSGDRLRAWLGIDKTDFYNPQKIAIMPMGFCYPGRGKSGDLPPRKECAPQWHERLMATLPKSRLTLLVVIKAVLTLAVLLVAATWIVRMATGRIEQVGTPMELYNNPANRFVAEFIGETNLLSGKMRGVDGDAVVMDWFGLTLRGHAPSGIPTEGASITASVRLEKLGFHKTRPDVPNAVQGRVISKTFLGSRMAVDMVVDQTDGAKLRAFVDADTGQSIGDDPIWAVWDSDSMAVLRD